jgi:hypothetical protein
MFPQMKTVLAIASISKTNGATATGNIDTVGCDFCTIDVVTSAADTTTNKLTTLKISEADDTNATSFSDITALVGGGVGGYTLPAPITTGENLHKFNIDCRARKRYLRVTVTPPTTQTIYAVANLGANEQAPVTAAKAGVNVLVEV